MKIRDMDRVADRAGVAALDTAIETATVFDVVVGARSIELVERRLATPLVKRYPIGDAFAFWAPARRWRSSALVTISDTGFVADDNGICGFAAVEFEAWYVRLILWHFYVSPERRRQGIGRALLARVEDHARSVGAERVWLETSNLNVPGIAAYERLGYALCGADTTLYDATPAASETAIYFAKRVT